MHDILLMGNDIEAMLIVKRSLSHQFAITDLGEASHVLGINLLRDRSKMLIGLNQASYIDKILEIFGMSKCKPTQFPLRPGIKLTYQLKPSSEEEVNSMENIPYASILGSLTYAMFCTRLNILVQFE